MAEATIRLKNEGDDAFSPERYGKVITITRKIYKRGHTSWKIGGVYGPVSQKRAELDVICDHFSIQTNNPINILTQGALI